MSEGRCCQAIAWLEKRDTARYVWFVVRQSPELVPIMVRLLAEAGHGELGDKIAKVSPRSTVCAVVGLLLSLIDFQGVRETVGNKDGLGTGGYIDNLKFGAVFFALFFILFEYFILRLQGRANSYDWKDSGASFAIYLFNGIM